MADIIEFDPKQREITRDLHKELSALGLSESLIEKIESRLLMSRRYLFDGKERTQAEIFAHIQNENELLQALMSDELSAR